MSACASQAYGLPQHGLTSPLSSDPGADFQCVLQAAERLGLPRMWPMPVITVAGTNGKGSVIAALDACYTQAAYRTAVYTSPHLHDYGERLLFSGKQQTPKDLQPIFAWMRVRLRGLHLSWFAWTTLAMLLRVQHRQADVDVLLLEVGLGGRWDPVNLVEPSISVITRIGLDHQAMLGTTRHAIAREKAGIMRRGRPCVCGDPSPPEALYDEARARGALLEVLGRDFVMTHEGGSWRWSKPSREGLCVQGQGVLKLHPHNAAAALAALQRMQGLLPVCMHAAGKQLAYVQASARCAYHEAQGVLYDVAHNPQAAAHLAEWMRAHPLKAGGRWLAVWAMHPSKACSEALFCLAAEVAVWHAAPLPGFSPSDYPKGSLRGACASLKKWYDHVSLDEALRAALAQRRAQDRLLVWGSFQTVAWVQNTMKG